MPRVQRTTELPDNLQKPTWTPQRGPQFAFFESPAFELLYGGAAGGGKSEALIFQSILYCSQYPKYRAVLFRRTFPELEKSLIPRISALLTGVATSRNSGKEWNFQNGSVLYLSHLQREEDKEKYKSAEFDYEGFDELTSFTETQYKYLFSRCRGKFQYPRFVRSATNPSGIGHAWVKSRFLEPQEGTFEKGGFMRYEEAYGWMLPGGRILTDFSEVPDDLGDGEPIFRDARYDIIKDKQSGLTRGFLPALIWGNRGLIKADPEYVKRLKAQDQKTQEALLYGLWNIFEGQFFAEWDPDLHVIDCFDVPANWRRFVGIDYGFAAPFAALWFAVDEHGIIYVYRELYGTKHTTEEQANMILDATGDERVEWFACDPSMMSRQGTGESHAQVYSRHGLHLLPASNKRLPRWAMMHELLGGKKIKIMRICVNLIRTLPSLSHSRTNPEDLDSSQEDHAIDALSYGLITLRGYQSTTPRPPTEDSPKWFREKVKKQQKFITRIRL